jgi:hypothetical protein
MTPGSAGSGGSIERLLRMVGDLPEHGSPIAASDCSIWEKRLFRR